METLTILFMLLAASYALGQAAKRLRLPHVAGPILVGLIVGSFFYEGIENVEILKSFADLGLIFLMFYVGLILDVKSFFREPKKVFFLSFFDIAVPFAVTFVVMRILGFDTLVSVILGVIMSITAEAISIDILKEMGLLKTRLGESIILTATIDDIIGILFLSGLVIFLEKGELTAIFVIFNLLIFFTVIYITRYIFLPYILKFTGKDSKTQLFIAGSLMVLLVSIVAEWSGFGSLIGALIAGIIVKYTFLEEDDNKEKHDMTELFEAVTFGFLAPFFFIWIGLNTDISAILSAPMLGLILSFLAVTTKVVGSLIGYYLAHHKFMEGIASGFGMAGKGVIELVLAEVARSAGIISQELFSAIVFMAIVTTIISPIAFSIIVKRISIS